MRRSVSVKSVFRFPSREVPAHTGSLSFQPVGEGQRNPYTYEQKGAASCTPNPGAGSTLFGPFLI
jgi:hypothetical protein